MRSNYVQSHLITRTRTTELDSYSDMLLHVSKNDFAIQLCCEKGYKRHISSELNIYFWKLDDNFNRKSFKQSTQFTKRHTHLYLKMMIFALKRVYTINFLTGQDKIIQSSTHTNWLWMTTNWFWVTTNWFCVTTNFV